MDIDNKEPTIMSSNNKVNPILRKDPHFHISTSTSAAAAASNGGGGVSGSAVGGDATAAAAPPFSSAVAEPGASSDKSNNRPETPGKEKKHLKWDEHAIEEHDLLRGTRMKIDEPNTPYTHYEHDSDAESNASGHHPRSPDESHPANANNGHLPNLANNWNDITTKLQAVADKRSGDAVSPAPSWQSSNLSDSEDEAARLRRRKDSDEFISMRKKHYNEAEAMKRWKAEHANDDDDEDDDEHMENA